MKLSKKTKAAIESMSWMLFMAAAPLLMAQFDDGKTLWTLDYKALTTGVIIALVRFRMNYKSKDDNRYGPDKTENE